MRALSNGPLNLRASLAWSIQQLYRGQCRAVTMSCHFPRVGGFFMECGMETLIERYDRLVAEGVLTPDPVQQDVLPEFERVRADLAKPVKTGWFRKTPEPVTGLYL